MSCERRKLSPRTFALRGGCYDEKLPNPITEKIEFPCALVALLLAAHAELPNDLPLHVLESNSFPLRENCLEYENQADSWVGDVVPTAAALSARSEKT